jgi:surface antigen
MITVLGASLMAASACATHGETGLATGAVGGGVLGGAIGGSTGALIGAALGGAVGYGVGHSMDVEDQRRMAFALEQNREAEWVNPNNGSTYEMQPTGSYYSPDGRQCRQFTMTAEVEGRPQRMNGTACRQPDGSWDMDQRG